MQQMLAAAMIAGWMGWVNMKIWSDGDGWVDWGGCCVRGEEPRLPAMCQSLLEMQLEKSNTMRTGAAHSAARAVVHGSGGGGSVTE
jgi:hypothetical protein